MQTTAEQFEGTTLPGTATHFKSVRDFDWYETRHGERLRGLVQWHPTEQCWLGLAGWHEMDDPDDVFNRFTVDCYVPGKGYDSSKYRAQPADLARLDGEQRLRAKDDADRAFRRTVVTTLVSAVSKVDTPCTAVLPDGTDLRVEMLTDEDPEFDELRLRFTIAWEGGVGYAQIARVQDAVPGISIGEWQAIPPSDTNPTIGIYTYLESDWITRLLDAAEEHGIDALESNPNLALDPSDGLAHVGDKAQITEAYITGIALRSLCGRRFIPTADPHTADECPNCMRIAGFIAHLRAEAGR